MKRAYSKPDVYFESFSLSTSIAAGCEEVANFASSSSCGLEYSDNITLFAESHVGCTPGFGLSEDAKVDGSQFGGKFDQLCYHNPSSNYNLFTS